MLRNDELRTWKEVVVACFRNSPNMKVKRKIVQVSWDSVINTFSYTFSKFRTANKTFLPWFNWMFWYYRWRILTLGRTSTNGKPAVYSGVTCFESRLGHRLPSIMVLFSFRPFKAVAMTVPWNRLFAPPAFLIHSNSILPPYYAISRLCYDRTYLNRNKLNELSSYWTRFTDV